MTLIAIIDRWIVPWLSLLADWSIRWGVLIAGLALWLAVRPPRRGATRYLLCAVVLAVGVLLPVVPQWGESVIAWPGPATRPGTAPVASLAGPSRPAVTTESHPGPQVGAPPMAMAVPSSRPQASSPTRPLGMWRLAALVIAAAWAFAALVHLVRLIGGRSLLARMRTGAVPVGEDSRRLLDQCRGEISLSRPVALVAHPAVTCPLTVGGRRPLILVPTDWDGWPEADRRACLVHELAHLARRDDWSKLIQELVRVPFFFHPLVIWLLVRLDRERELLCDEAVVALGAERIGYAQLLLSLARRPGHRLLLPGAVAIRPSWLPVLDRGTVAVRIQRLLEDDMSTDLSPALSPPSARRLLALATLVAALALGIGGLHVRAVEPRTGTEPVQSSTAQAKPASLQARMVTGIVSDSEGQTLPDADLVCVIGGTSPRRDILKTDRDGEFSCLIPDGELEIHVYAYKPGFAPSASQEWMPVEERGKRFPIKLRKPEPFAGTLVDRENTPVAGAKVRIEMIATQPVETKGFRGGTVAVCFEHVRPDDVSMTLLESVYSSYTDAKGRFTFELAPPGGGLKIGVIAPGKGIMRVVLDGLRGSSMMKEFGVIPREATAQPLTVIPATGVSGRVVTNLPGTRVSGLQVHLQGSRVAGAKGTYQEGQTTTDDQGRFWFRGLDEGTANIFLGGHGPDGPWTYRAAQDVAFRAGTTAEVTIELIRGVSVEGTVATRGTGKPIEKAMVGVYGPYRPRSGAATQPSTTDAQGRFHYRLPPGETYLYVMGPPPGYTRLPGEGSTRTVNIPEGAAHFEVPPLELEATLGLHGRVIDAKGNAVPGIAILGVSQPGHPGFGFAPAAGAIVDERGEFRLGGRNFEVVPGKEATLSVRLGDGREIEVPITPAANGSVTVRLPVTAMPQSSAAPSGVRGPQDVAPDELAGLVVDVEGRPIEGVEVDAWTWYPGNETRTDARGGFRLGGFDPRQKIEVRFRKEGYSPRLFKRQSPGETGWIIALGNKTYFEGTVIGPGGEPIAAARVRAREDDHVWTEALTGPDGRYRMYAQADDYDIFVRVSGVGVARLLRVPLLPDESKTLDIRLTPGVDFRAKVIGSLNGQPVAGVRLWNWQYRGIQGRSSVDGMLQIRDMFPGRFQFDVDAPGYARWWSEQAASEWSRRQILDRDDGRGGSQRNFDPIDFDLSRGMEPVTLTIERAVKITGRVVDPDGKPVAGATVAPAMTGSDNSLTGDTRFSVETDREGRFIAWLPASGRRQYNLLAHDGKYGQWRTWANGVLPPLRTQPGQEIRDVELRLTRPATVRGRVLDTQGTPVIGCEVRARATDRLEQHYYGPITKTDDKGRFEFRFLRPGKQYVWAGNVYYFGEDDPSDDSRRVLTVAAGQVTEGVDLILQAPGTAN